MTKKEYHRMWAKKHKKELRKYAREYRKNNLKRIHERVKKYKNNHAEQIKNSDRKYYLKNRERILKQCKEYGKNYRVLNKEKRNEYMFNRRKTNINHRLKENLSKRIWHVLKENSKSLKTMELIGCSIEFLKGYLESKFTKGMTWDNYGKWHIDHIKPCASFDLKNKSQQKICFNYINLQPLWQIDNLRKNKY
jgi:vacuolar-type H+-ATPase subunit E/Vma4